MAWTNLVMDGLTDGQTQATTIPGGQNWPQVTKGHLFYTTLSFVHHFKAMGEFKLELQFGNTQFGSKPAFFVSCDLEIWQMTMKNYRAPLLCCLMLCASFHSHWWIQTGVTVRKKRPIWVKINNSFLPCDLEIWRMTLRNDRAPLLSNIKLCVSFYHHTWILPGVTVQKRPNCFLTCDIDLWPITWTFFMDVTFVIAITPENFIMI